MPRINNRDRILEAAESTVVEVGAGHLSLDLVAERAQVSKGGLLYHYPSKEALLKAMIERMQQRLDVLRTAAEEESTPGPWRDVQAQARLMLKIQPGDKQLMSSLVAAMANQPELLEPVRRRYVQRFKALARDPENFTRKALFWLATDGLCLTELLSISPLTKVQRRQVLEELIRLTESDELSVTSMRKDVGP